MRACIALAVLYLPPSYLRSLEYLAVDRGEHSQPGRNKKELGWSRHVTRPMRSTESPQRCCARPLAQPDRPAHLE